MQHQSNDTSKTPSHHLNEEELTNQWKQYYADLQQYNNQLLQHNSQYNVQNMFSSSVQASRPSSRPSTLVSEEYPCDACDKSFETLQQFKAHISTHVKCPQCDFVAAGKIVKIHEQDVHSSGIVIGSLDSPEDIARWIEERKRKYPTTANVAKKQKRDDGLGLLQEYDSEPEVKEPVKETRKPRICKYFANGKCRNGDKCKFSHEKSESVQEAKPTTRFGKRFTRQPLFEKLAEQDALLRQKERVVHVWKLLVESLEDVIEPVKVISEISYE